MGILSGKDRKGSPGAQKGSWQSERIPGTPRMDLRLIKGLPKESLEHHGIPRKGSPLQLVNELINQLIRQLIIN